MHESLAEDVDEDTLFPAEREWIAAAVPSRRREFTAGRRCARIALEALGQPSVPLLPDAAGAVRWPPGYVGSITHCTGFRAAALARTADFAALGIDAETDAATARRGARSGGPRRTSGAWLDSSGAGAIDVERASFRASCWARSAGRGTQPSAFDGRWAAVAGLLLTAVVLPAGESDGSA